MSLLNILRYPDVRLHKVADPVKVFDNRLKTLINNMAETMYEAPGIGLAATQVNVHEQLIIVDISEKNTDLQVFINPRILWSSEEKRVHDEGCLSVPGIYESIERPSQIKIWALNAEGNPFEIEARGLLSVCIQHEIDHLNGKIFIEHLSLLKNRRIKNRILKEERNSRRNSL